MTVLIINKYTFVTPQSKRKDYKDKKVFHNGH